MLTVDWPKALGAAVLQTVGCASVLAALDCKKQVNHASPGYTETSTLVL
jgi:hypothetical protein